MTDLSVIVVSWNTRELVLACLAALEEELDRFAFDRELRSEVIVVDNGSRDGTVAAVQKSFPAVRTTSLERNYGFAAAVNIALADTLGRSILLLNSDVILGSGCLARCLSVLCQDSGQEATVGVVGPQLLHPDGRLQNSVHALPSLWTELLPTWLLESLLPSRFPSKRRSHRPDESLVNSPAPATGLQEVVEVEAILGAVFFVRREVVEKVGALCEDYFFFMEETDWCCRIRRAGYRVLHVPAARAVHLSGASSKRRDPARTRIEFHRSLYRFLQLNRGPTTARIAMMVRVLKCAGTIALLALPALVSALQRGRLAERVRLLRWHLSGRPSEWGLAGTTFVSVGDEGVRSTTEPPWRTHGHGSSSQSPK